MKWPGLPHQPCPNVWHLELSPQHTLGAQNMLLGPRIQGDILLRDAAVAAPPYFTSRHHHESGFYPKTLKQEVLVTKFLAKRVGRSTQSPQAGAGLQRVKLSSDFSLSNGKDSS